MFIIFKTDFNAKKSIICETFCSMQSAQNIYDKHYRKLNDDINHIRYHICEDIDREKYGI